MVINYNYILLQGNQQQSYEAQQQAKQKQQEMINSMLSQVLTQDATARCKLLIKF